MWWRRRRALKGLDDDIRDHIARETGEHVARGMTPEEARRQSLVRFGNVSLAKEDTRAVWRGPSLADLFRDARRSLRMLGRNSVFASVTILSLALAVGATLAVFTVVNALNGISLSTLRPPTSTLTVTRSMLMAPCSVPV